MGHQFKNIGLTFSGGGFRAAAFTFGSVSFFHKIGLLKEVSGISSVSGGSITAVKYAQCLIEGKSYEIFFKEYYNFLFNDSLSDDALKTLNNKSEWSKSLNRHKTVNPINAFAVQYNKFTNQKTLGDFDDYVKKKNATLKKLYINATDFTSANQFRIKNINVSGEKFGNRSIIEQDSRYQDYWREVKLGDALAASSAFPGGFESMLYPKDFVGEKDDLKNVPLMDGGIIDNQGSSSLTPSNPKKSKYDFYFVCDVASPYIDAPYKAKPYKILSQIVEFLTSIISLILLSILVVYFYRTQNLFWYSVFLIPLVLIVFIQAGLIIASRYLNKITGVKNRIRIPTRNLGNYIYNRLTGLIYILKIIMLKNSRRLYANKLYNDFEETAITAGIYELRCEKNQFDKENQDILPHPEHQRNWREIRKFTKDISCKIIENTKDAADFGTTLWFNSKNTENKMLDKLIACGQYTTCYNLIAHMIRSNDKYPIDNDPERKELFKTLIGYWNKFQLDPFWLLQEEKST